MKTSELTGAALHWAVAKCQGVTQPIYRFAPDPEDTHFDPEKDYTSYFYIVGPRWACGPFEPSTIWQQGGPIIEQWAISLCPDEYTTGNTRWCATCTNEGELYEAFGPTPLIAAMRCYVASKLGDDIEIPEELTC